MSEENNVEDSPVVIAVDLASPGSDSTVVMETKIPGIQVDPTPTEETTDATTTDSNNDSPVEPDTGSISDSAKPDAGNPETTENENDEVVTIHAAPMPIMSKWKCHKEVQAEFIEDIVQVDDETYQVIPRQPTKLKLPIYVSQEWVDKHNPDKGGVIVKYADGYVSYSPAIAFREGYTRL